MIFLAGIPKRHFDKVIKAVASALPGEAIAGLPSFGPKLLNERYIEECGETIRAYHSERPNCFDNGLAIIAIVQVGESFGDLADFFYPFALVKVLNFSRRFVESSAQSDRDKNDIIEMVTRESKRQNKLKRTISTYTKSKSNRTPLLLPIRHFNEPKLSNMIREAWKALPESNESFRILEALTTDFESQFPFSKKERRASGYFVNSRDIWFRVPGRDLHGAAHAAVEDHPESCFFSGILRVGGAILRGFHYDCTKAGGKYSGTFSSCHDQIVTKAGNPHLNVYSNDYIR